MYWQENQVYVSTGACPPYQRPPCPDYYSYTNVYGGYDTSQNGETYDFQPACGWDPFIYGFSFLTWSN